MGSRTKMAGVTTSQIFDKISRSMQDRRNHERENWRSRNTIFRYAIYQESASLDLYSLVNIVHIFLSCGHTCVCALLTILTLFGAWCQCWSNTCIDDHLPSSESKNEDHSHLLWSKFSICAANCSLLVLEDTNAPRMEKCIHSFAYTIEFWAP